MLSQEDSDTENSFGLCILDASTGEFNMSTFVDDVCGTKLETVMRQLRPKEILFTKVSQVWQPLLVCSPHSRFV